jgi:hypothetical protein
MASSTAPVIAAADPCASILVTAICRARSLVLSAGTATAWVSTAEVLAAKVPPPA